MCLTVLAEFQCHSEMHQLIKSTRILARTHLGNLLLVSRPHSSLRVLHVSSSIGIAVFPDDGTDAETLLKNADAALYWVKDKGRNNFQHYTLKLNSQAYKLLNIENAIMVPIQT